MARRRLLQSSMRQKYEDSIHDESGHIIHDSKMAIRHHKRYLPYVFGFLVVWFVYHFLTRPRPPPLYACEFVKAQVRNYTWTFPDCPPVSPVKALSGVPPPVLTDECFRHELPEDAYGPRPKAPLDHQSDVTPDSRIKVPGLLRQACMPFPMEAFPKETDHTRDLNHLWKDDAATTAAEGAAAPGATSDKSSPTTPNTAHRQKRHTSTASAHPKFAKFAPEGWLFGVFAVYDRRVGPLSQLRIFAVSRIVPGEIYCQYSCIERAHAVVHAPARATLFKIDDTRDDSCFWQQYMFTCDMHDDDRCTPGYASLSKAPCGPVAGIVPVLHAERPTQTPPHPFAFCLSTISDKSDSDAGYLVEFLEGHRHFGIEKIFLYGTFNVSRRYQAVLDVYRSQGLVEVIDWDIPREVNVVYKFAQILQYSHCSYVNLGQTNYLALLELEDFPFTAHNSDWKALFEQLESNERMDNVASMTVGKRSLCLPGLQVNYGNVGEKLGDGRKSVELRLVNQHVLAKEFNQVPTYIINPAGVIAPYIYQNKVISMKGWRSNAVSAAMALTYYYGYIEDSHCKTVDLSFRNDVTLCKHIPAITTNALHALNMFDLINAGNRRALKTKDLVCS